MTGPRENGRDNFDSEVSRQPEDLANAIIRAISESHFGRNNPGDKDHLTAASHFEGLKNERLPDPIFGKTIKRFDRTTIHLICLLSMTHYRWARPMKIRDIRKFLTQANCYVDDHSFDDKEARNQVRANVLSELGPRIYMAIQAAVFIGGLGLGVALVASELLS